MFPITNKKTKGQNDVFLEVSLKQRLSRQIKVADHDMEQDYDIPVGTKITMGLHFPDVMVTTKDKRLSCLSLREESSSRTTMLVQLYNAR